MSSVYTLAYASSSTYLLAQEDLDHLLEAARKKNKQRGITGILLYHDGNFMQILEGPKETVLETYALIENDPRHKGIIRLLSRSFPTRNFDEWSMGYARCTEYKLEENKPGFNVLLERDHINTLNQDHMHEPIRNLLISFHRIVYKTNMKVIDQPFLTS
ncbi:MAG: BLUF domain-containing protein [Rhodothermaceae bacterium]|nr:BLUF domain-containing protein [Rhodothermaceae bacterium]